MKGIRLPTKDVLSIIKAFRSVFSLEDHLWLFGSRADLLKRGGDIDLYIETTISCDEAVKARLRFFSTLTKAFDDRKIDIVINNGAIDLPIYHVAKNEGIKIL